MAFIWSYQMSPSFLAKRNPLQRPFPATIPPFQKLAWNFSTYNLDIEFWTNSLFDRCFPHIMWYSKFFEVFSNVSQFLRGFIQFEESGPPGNTFRLFWIKS